jgi:hypothetical protein
MSAPPRGNGTPEAAPLPEHRQKMVEAANLKIEQMTVQLESLKQVVGMMEGTYLQTKMENENRVSTYQAQRDEAVARHASLEATLANIYVILRNTINEPEAAA